jgi:hypothetical protein
MSAIISHDLLPNLSGTLPLTALMGVEPTTSVSLYTASFRIDYKAYAFFYGIRNPSASFRAN